MADGLALGLVELVKNGRVLNIEGITLLPRLILMTDGGEERKEEVCFVRQSLATFLTCTELARFLLLLIG